MKLSDRLQRIADEIRPGETMADIGTDHGFLPIYLYNEGISPHVILSDVSKGSMEKALADCQELGNDHDFDLRTGDGLQVLESGEVDVVVIAGMGGILMTEILGYNLEHSQSFSRFILQPRNNLGYLVNWLGQNGFVLEKEILVRERKRICEILVVTKGERAPMEASYDEAPWLYGYPTLLRNNEKELLLPYLTEAKDKAARNLSRMQMGAKPDETQLAITEKTIAHLEHVLEEVEA